MATRNAEVAIHLAQVTFDKISTLLEEIMKKLQTEPGTIFFIQSDLDQLKKYLPDS